MYLLKENICPLCERTQFLYKTTKMCYECYNDQKEQLMLKSQISSRSFYEIDQITDQIYLGDYEGAFRRDLLLELGITNVLVCGYFLQEIFPNEFKYMTIELQDDKKEDILMFFDKTNDFIDSSNKVYIHCMAGISRSPTITIAYLMWKNNLPFFKAFEIVKKKRNIFPNLSFIKQLQKYQEILNIDNGNEEIFLEFKREYNFYYFHELKDNEELEFN